MRIETIEMIRQRLIKKGIFDNTDMISRARKGYVFSIESAAFLDGLVFPYHRDTILIAPKGFLGGRFYTLKEVADRFFSLNQSFIGLAQDDRLSQNERIWYAKCQEIYDGFDPKKFQDIILRSVRGAEKWNCPKSVFRILDGLHRLLVLMVLIEEKKVDFFVFDGIVLV